MSSRNMSSKQEPLGPIGELTLLESNSEIDSTSHYKEQLHFSTLCILQQDTKYLGLCSTIYCMQTLHTPMFVI